MFGEGLCRHRISGPGENTPGMKSQLCFCMRCKQVWVFESQACLRTWGTHFVTKHSQQEIAGRRYTLNLEPSSSKRTENIRKQNQSHGPPRKTNTPKSYFLNCTPGRAWSGRLWKWEKRKHWPEDLLKSLREKKNTRVFLVFGSKWYCAI